MNDSAPIHPTLERSSSPSMKSWARSSSARAAAKFDCMNHPSSNTLRKQLLIRPRLQTVVLDNDVVHCCSSSTGEFYDKFRQVAGNALDRIALRGGGR
jgi:hypothetical protein